MNELVVDLVAQHGEKLLAIRKRVVELSKLPYSDIQAIEAELKNPSTFATLDAEKYQSASLEGIVTETTPSQTHVLRFLIGYKYDVERASLHLLREQRWRLVDKVAEIRAKAIKVGLENVIPINIRVVAPQSCQLGVSKTGHIISLTRVGYIKPKTMMRTLTPEDYTKYCFEANEIIVDAMERGSIKTGRMLGVVQILDLDGLGMKHFDRAMINGYLQVAIAFASERYVEMVYRTLVVNAPWVFTAIWKICQGFLNESQREKVRVCGKGSKSENELLQYIDKDVLPDFLYGQRKIPYLEPDNATKRKFEIEQPEMKNRLKKFFEAVDDQKKLATIDDLVAKLDETSTFDKLAEKLEYSYRKTAVKMPPNSRNLSRINLDKLAAEIDENETVVSH